MTTAAVEPRSRVRLLAAAVILAAAVAFLVVNAASFTAPFGNSHDGRNAGEWAAGSRALHVEGPITSRLGGRHLDSTSYANHPPLIYVETALSESAFGAHPWSSRLPALLSTLVAAALAYRLLDDAGLHPLTAAVGGALVLLTPMTFAYGSMLDTPVTSLAFGVGVLVVWQRQRQGRPPPAWVLALVAGLACLSGWEAILLTWLAALDIVWHQHRDPGPDGADRASWALLVGAAAGTVLSVGWATWVYGDLSTLYDQLVRRSSGDQRASFLGALRQQSAWMGTLFGADLLGTAACVVAAVRDRGYRPLAVLVLITTVAYPIVLFNGAFYHDYWNYWFVLTVAVGGAWALDQLRRSLRRRQASPAAALAFVAVAALAVMIPPLVTPTDAARNISAGVGPGRLMAAGHFAASQGAVADIGPTTDPSTWIAYDADLPEVHLADGKDLLAFAERHPTAQVLVSGTSAPVSSEELCQALALPAGHRGAYGGWYLAPAAALAQRYGAIVAR